MKRFVLRVAFFAGVLVLVFGTICGVELAWEVRAYARELKAPSEAHILLASDSQLDMGVDPGVDPVFFNFSAHGRTMDQAHLAMLDLFRVNPGRFRTVVIDISPSAAVDAFDQPIAKMGYAAQYYLLHWLHPRENTRDMTGQVTVFRDNMVGRRWRLFWRSLRGKGDFTSSICGRFTPVFESQAEASPEDFRGQFKARAYTVNSVPAVTAEAPVFRHVDAIVRLVRANGAEPVLVTTPWHPVLLDACRPEKLAAFTAVVSDYARRTGCRYVNLLRTALPDKCWFDAQHLNVRGARLFTPMLRTALEGTKP